MSIRHQVAAGDEGRRVSLPKLLFAVLGAPVLWSIHLGVIYLVLTIGCISPWDGGEWGVGVATVLFALASAWAGWTAWSMYREMDPDPHHGERDWARFLLVLGIGGSILFTAVIVLEGLSPVFVAGCA